MEPHILDRNRHIRPCASLDLLYMTTGFHLHIMINEKLALLCNSISRVLNQLSTALLKLMGDGHTYACTGARRSRLLEKNLGRDKWRHVRISQRLICLHTPLNAFELKYHWSQSISATIDGDTFLLDPREISTKAQEPDVTIHRDPSRSAETLRHP